MRIGFDAKRAFSNNTGLGNYSRDTINLLSYYLSKNSYFLYTTIENKNPRTHFISNRENIDIKTPESLLNRMFKAYWRSKGIIKDLCLNKIEIYHGLSNEIPIGIEKTSIKTVVTIHDLIFIRYPKLFKTIDRKIYYKKFYSACKRANKIIAVSEQTKQDIINFFSIPSKKIEVVYQGCNQIFQNNIEEMTRKKTLEKYHLPREFLLYVGAIEERKNLLTLLKTIKDLPQKKLVVIGNGKSYKSKCLNFVKKHHFSNRIIFLNSLSLKEMASIYQTAKIMIYPSLFEGFGIPILESLFSKTPVITSKGGCFSEAGGPSSKYINPLSVNEMKKAILEIENSSKIQKEMSIKGFEYAKRFTNEKIASNLMHVYKNI